VWQIIKAVAWPVVMPLAWLWGRYMSFLDPNGQIDVSQDYSKATPPETDLLNSPVGAYLPLTGDGYKAEEELAEKYRSFVSEILRLALLSLAGFTFLNAYMHKSYWVLSFASAGALFLFASIVLSLQFLFGASEGLRWYIAGYRHSCGSPEEKAKVHDILEWRGKIIRECRLQKQGAAGCLLLGALLMSAAIFISLFIELQTKS
jgi:uncharacterized membrane protein YedE/YeeE